MSDGWTQVNSTGGGNIVKLGDKDGQVREVTGVFTGVRPGLHGLLFDFEGEGGEGFTVPHNKALDDLDPDKYEGKLVRLEFKGLKPLKGGKTFKDISITAYDGEITKALAKKYPSLAVSEKQEEGEAEDMPF